MPDERCPGGAARLPIDSKGRDQVAGRRGVHQPRTFPECDPAHYATFWLDPHGSTLEVVSFERVG